MNRPEPLSRLALPLTTNTEIICGNCAGDADEPRKTLLTIDNHCAGCGGRHFTLALPQAVNQNERTTNGQEHAYARPAEGR